MEKRKSVMISSTINDLPEHRKEVMDACLRQGMFPIMMEHLPANDEKAIHASLKMVDDADIYVGIFGYRYGYIPQIKNQKQISITEMEYNRAVKRKIPRLIFIMDKDYPIKIENVEAGDITKNFELLKKRLLTNNIINFFKSPADLRAHVINSLSKYREANVTQFHYFSDIPEPPETYIAHPYTLLQTRKLIGRQNELNILNDWVVDTKASNTSKISDVSQARIMNIVAIGGMGKSALAWKWFNDIAPQKMVPIAGQMWWSFYESNGSFENFIIRALAYVSRRSIKDVQNIPSIEREAQLLAILDREPYLFVLDGLERILVAYTRIDTAHLTEDNIDQQTANRLIIKNETLPFVGQHILRKTADPRVGTFLRKLTAIRASRILISSRLYPTDLETVTGEPSIGCHAIFLSGLLSVEALELWQSFGVTGKGSSLLPLFDTFGNHPLLIQILAGEIARYRPAPGNFERWQNNHPNFNPFSLPLVHVKSHIMQFALYGLDYKMQKILQTIAAFHMPVQYDTLFALTVRGKGRPKKYNLFSLSQKNAKNKVSFNEQDLDVALSSLEDRGLLGWDKRANRYDLHPVIRGVVRDKTNNTARHQIYYSLRAYFESFSPIENWHDVESQEDLTPRIELYNALIALGCFDDAIHLFYTELEKPLVYSLSLNAYRAQLLELLFPHGLSQISHFRNADDRSWVIGALATAYHRSGQPGRAVPLYHRHNKIVEEDLENLSIGLDNLTHALLTSGSIYRSQATASSALFINRDQKDKQGEAISLGWLGLALSASGMETTAQAAYYRSIKIFDSLKHPQGAGVSFSYQSQLSLWKRDYANAYSLADRAWELAKSQFSMADLIEAIRRLGEASLGLGEFTKANEFLYLSLTNARAVNLVDEELSSLVALAELQRHDDLKIARELLDDVWESVERGPYPLIYVDALNVLTQIERDSGDNIAAIDTATKAYQLAWCGGEPYAYYWGLVAARKHLRELGAPEPEMTPFEKSKYEPMPQVEINLKDEFYVDENEFANKSGTTSNPRQSSPPKKKKPANRRSKRRAR